MKAWSMFVHSVRLVLNNLDVALRVSLVLYLVQAASQYMNYKVAQSPMITLPGGTQIPDVSAGDSLLMIVLGLGALVTSIWIAVAWHRFVLLAEMPKGWLPQWPSGHIMGYLWRSILLALIVAVVVVPVATVFALLGSLVLATAASVGIGSYAFFRLSPVLPAIAVGQDMSFGDALAATRDSGATLFGLAGLMILGSLLLQMPTILSGDPGSVISLVYGIVVGWFATMIGVSLLTTVYGHYVEGRAID